MSKQELPLPDYDDLPTGAIESRVRTLTEAGVEALLEYEQGHADRPAVKLILQHRLERLRQGAEPSGGSPQSPAPERGQRAPQNPQAPVVEGPPVNPPSQGAPENPAQPRA